MVGGVVAGWSKHPRTRPMLGQAHRRATIERRGRRRLSCRRWNLVHGRRHILGRLGMRTRNRWKIRSHGWRYCVVGEGEDRHCGNRVKPRRMRRRNRRFAGRQVSQSGERRQHFIGNGHFDSFGGRPVVRGIAGGAGNVACHVGACHVVARTVPARGTARAAMAVIVVEDAVLDWQTSPGTTGPGLATGHGGCQQHTADSDDGADSIHRRVASERTRMGMSSKSTGSRPEIQA
jgi:hypothetical protein